ncbi:hypothetical protein Tco_0261071, partial [Tanacetum coccineum]
MTPHQTVARDEVEMSARGTAVVSDDRVTHPVVPDDIPEPAREEGAVIESIQRDQGHKIVTTRQQSTVMSERISELERDNTRLRGMMDVASQRVTRLWTMPNTQSGATMTREGINKLTSCQVAEALEPCYDQNYDEFPQTSPSFQQQYICCTRCGARMRLVNMSIQDMEDLKHQYLDEMKTLINEKDYRNGRIDIEIKINELKGNFNEMSIEINKKKKLQQLEQVANLKVDSLIMEDEHLDIIPETESDEFIKSSVENLVQNLRESEGECECDVPDCDDSQTTNFSTFLVMTSQVMRSEFNPIHNEDLDSTPKNDRFNTESYLLESLLNCDTLMVSFPKIDSLFEGFTGELKTIPLGVANIEHEECISMMERLLYDNSTPRPPEAFQANYDTI